MLPLVDLLNHTSDPSKLTTTLKRAEGTGDWEMRASRDLQRGRVCSQSPPHHGFQKASERLRCGCREEVLHSYGAHDAAELVRTCKFYYK